MALAWVRIIRGASLAGLAMGLTGAIGCQVNPFSVPVDLVTAQLARDQLTTWEPQVLGATLEEADEKLGQRNDTLEPLDGGELWIVYNLPGNPGSESYMLVKVAPDGRVGQLGVFKRNRDGLLDLWLARELLGKCLGHTPAECVKQAQLGEAWRILRSRNTGLEAHVHLIRETRPAVPTNPIPPKYVVMCYDDAGKCADVRIVGVTAQGTARFGPLFWPVPAGGIGFPVPSWFPKIPFVPLLPDRPGPAPRSGEMRPQRKGADAAPGSNEVKGQHP